MTGRSYTSSADQRYKFVSKERDASTGYDHLGDRNYDSWSGRLLSVDPFGDKYPFLSPYSYGACNPISVIDYNGDSLWINDNGNNILFSAGMKYNGSNKNVSSLINNLNSIYSTDIGNKALSRLMSSQGNYNYSFIDGKKGEFFGNSNGTGGNAMVPIGQEDNLELLAHETFHAYMFDQGSSPGSIANEVQAFLYGAAVSFRLTNNYQPFGNAGVKRGQLYDDAMTKLLWNGFSSIMFKQAVVNFKNGSLVTDPIYQKMPLYISPEKFLIRNFYPLIH